MGNLHIVPDHYFWLRMDCSISHEDRELREHSRNEDESFHHDECCIGPGYLGSIRADWHKLQLKKKCMLGAEKKKCF